MIKTVLSPFRIQILTALLEGEVIPYRLAERSQNDAGHYLIVKQCQVYSAVPSLLQASLIEPGIGAGTYRLTPYGLRVLRNEKGRMEALCKLIHERQQRDMT